MAATPHAKGKNARTNSLHIGVLMRDGFFTDQVDGGQLVDKTLMKKGWEPALLYIFGDKTLLRVRVLTNLPSLLSLKRNPSTVECRTPWDCWKSLDN